jgi:hypothetical protein
MGTKVNYQYGLYLLIWLFSTCYIFIVRYPFGVDEQFTIAFGYRVAIGEIPYRDFWLIYPPGVAWISALQYLLVEHSPFGHKLFYCLYQGLTPLLVYIFFKRLEASQKLSYFIAILFLLFNNPFWFQLGSIIFLHLILSLIHKTHSKNITWLGIFLSISVLIKHDFALVQIFVSTITIIYLGRFSPDAPNKLWADISKQLGILFFVIIVSLTPVILYFFQVNALPQMIESLTVRGIKVVADSAWKQQTFLTLISGSNLRMENILIFFYFFFVPLFYLAFGFWSGKSLLKKFSRLQLIIIIYSVYGLLIYPKSIYGSSIPSATTTFFPVFIITGILLLERPKPLQKLKLKQFSLMAWLFISILSSTKVLSDFHTLSLYGFKTGNEAIPVVDEILKITGPTPESIFETTHYSILNAKAKAPPSTYFHHFFPGMILNEKDREGVYHDIVSKKVQYIVRTDTKLWPPPFENFDSMVPKAAQYIKENYEFKRQVGHLEILEYRDKNDPRGKRSFETIFSGNAGNLKIVDPSKPNKNDLGQITKLNEETVLSYSGKGYYYFPSPHLTLKPGIYKLTVISGFSSQSESKGMEIMVGNWSLGKILFGKQFRKFHDKPELKKQEFKFHINQASNSQIRVSSLGGTSIHLNSLSLIRLQ